MIYSPRGGAHDLNHETLCFLYYFPSEIIEQINFLEPGFFGTYQNNPLYTIPRTIATPNIPKNICLLLRGFFYHENYTASSHGKNFLVDYSRSRESIKKNVIKALGVSDVYISTYSSAKNNEIVDFYKPKEILYNDPKGSEANCIINGLRMLKRQENLAENILISRADLDFLVPLDKLGFKEGKMNFLWREYNQNKWEKHRRICNLLWMFPKRHIDLMIESLEKVSKLPRGGPKMIDYDTHCFMSQFPEEVMKDIHVCIPFFLTSGGANPVCNIVRIVPKSEKV